MKEPTPSEAPQQQSDKSTADSKRSDLETTTQTAQELKTLMLKAWDPKSLQSLGEKQKKLLLELAGRKAVWTEETLKDLLITVKYDFPEELVDISRSWDQPKTQH